MSSTRPPLGESGGGSIPPSADTYDLLARSVQEWSAHNRNHVARWIQSRQINPADFSPEDAIQEALILLWHRLICGIESPIHTRNDFFRRFPRILRQVIVDKERYIHAVKRDGGGVASLSWLEEHGFDRIDPRAMEPEQIASRSEEIGGILDFLRGIDDSLHAFVVMKTRGYTNPEVARELGISTATVERMIGRIRSLLEGRGHGHR